MPNVSITAVSTFNMSNNFPDVGPADGFPSSIVVKDGTGLRFIVLRLVAFSSSIFEFGTTDGGGSYEFIKFTNNANGSNHSSSAGLDTTESAMDLDEFCNNSRVTY